MAVRRAFRNMPRNTAELDRLFRNVEVDDGSLELEQIEDIATDRLLGRDTADAGSPEELTVSGGIEFTGSGGIRRSALTGDVTASAGSNTTTIPDNTVTYAKIQNVSATDRLLGRSTAGAGDIEEIVCTAAGRALLDDATAAAQRTTLGFDDGVYTPTLTNVANLDGSTAYQCQYMRVGSTVTVSGSVDIDPTAAAATQLGISLPIASNFSAAENCCGVAAAPGVASESGVILGDVANDRAELQLVTTSTADHGMYFTFTYRIL